VGAVSAAILSCFLAPPFAHAQAVDLDGRYQVTEHDETFNGATSPGCATPWSLDPPTKAPDRDDGVVTVTIAGSKVTFGRQGGQTLLEATLSTKDASFTGVSGTKGQPGSMYVVNSSFGPEAKFENLGGGTTFAIIQPRVNYGSSIECFQVDIRGTRIGGAGTAAPSLTGSGGGIGAPVIGLIALGGVGALGLGAVAVRRASSPQQRSRQDVCDEAIARWALMVPRRVDMVQRLRQGTSALSRAYWAQEQAVGARAELHDDYISAVATLAAAGAVAAVPLLVAAASISATASTMAISEGMAAWAGVSETTFETGMVAVRAAFSSTAQSMARAASLARVGAGVTAGAAANTGVIQQLMSSGMASYDAAVAQQASMTQQLVNACKNLTHDLAELDRQIGDTLATLRGCPNIGPDDIEDPRTPMPGMPDPPGNPIKG
jgi:hypothetical protein